MDLSGVHFSCAGILPLNSAQGGIVLLALLLAALSGLFMALQGTLNSALSKAVGLLEASFIVQVVGSLTGLALLLAGLGQGSLLKFREAPWYTYLGGLLGIAIIYLVASSIAQAGVASATTAVIVGQVLTAAVIDWFGWFGVEQVPFSLWKGLGILLMAGGAWLLLSR